MRSLKRRKDFFYEEKDFCCLAMFHIINLESLLGEKKMKTFFPSPSLFRQTSHESAIVSSNALAKYISVLKIVLAHVAHVKAVNLQRRFLSIANLISSRDGET